MKRLTKRENEIMNLFWDRGAMFVKELQSLYPEPQPYGRSSLSGIISNYLGNSYLNAVSELVREEKITIEELKGLIDEIEKNRK